jgi:hypothetical protein
MRRRDFLRTGAALPLVGMKALEAAQSGEQAASCIMLMLVGGPSHLDTWDMKPDAPSGIRGPFRPIRTNVPGIEISEIFPRMARHAEKYALVRSLYHDAPSVHDTGHQLMQTGRLFDGEFEYPHAGCVTAKLLGSRIGLPGHVILPYGIGNTGGNMPHGQSAGFLGQDFEPHPLMAESLGSNSAAIDKYGSSSFGRGCLMARHLVESGVRFVTVNMFETVFDQITWDSHGSKPFSSLSSYRDEVGPMFDRAYSALIEDLSDRGLLGSTLVVAAGEFGRTPKINPAGGRDHWPQCWTILLAGGGIRGGQIYGSSDRFGMAPQDDPVTPAMLVATIYRALGIPLHTTLEAPGGRLIPVVEPGTHAIDRLFS